MSWGVLNAAMLVGLAGVALPVIIHLLNRRRVPVVDWGAMQFLEPGRLARRRIRLAELLLMAARMLLLAIVALAMARPFWAQSTAAQTGTAAGSEVAGPPRDIVLVLDVSASMEHDGAGTPPLARATAWATTFIKECRPGDSIALLLAGDRVRRVFDSPTFDVKRAEAALGAVKSGRGSSDLPAALAEAFRILERTENPDREIIVLADGQRYPWRPGETNRWALLRSLHSQLPVQPRIVATDFGSRQAPEAPNASVGRLVISRSLVTPGLPLEVTTTVAIAGSGSFSGAVELLVDGQVASSSPQVIGPIAGGSRVPVSFRNTIAKPGSHLVAVRLLGGDALAADDVSEIPLRVVPVFRVLLVNGEPGVEPFSGETDFMRAALAPSGDETPQFRVRVIAPEALTRQALDGEQVVVLANVDRLSREQSAALSDFVEMGGGILVAPGDRTDASSLFEAGWMPARLTEMKGSASDRKVIAHPAPRGFAGPYMTPFGQGDAPALSEVDFFAFYKLEPAPGSAVLGRLDTGDPWLIEGRQGRGRILVLATPIDAEAGTLPVNPDFVPLTHEWVLHLAGDGEPPEVRPGEPLVFPLDQLSDPSLTTLLVETPSGLRANAEVIRGAGATFARFDDTAESGVYRLSLPDPGGGVVYGAVARDERESDVTRLDPAEADRLADGWPLRFETGPAGEAPFAGTAFASRHEVWRYLVLLALAGLCLEIHLTRRLVRLQSASE
jgi:hypothetical protein